MTTLSVKRRRNPTWPDGTPRMCTLCPDAGRKNRRRAEWVGERRWDDGTVLPVGYCEQHRPEEGT